MGFKVGDVVTGRPRGEYTITTDQAQMTVIELHPYDRMTVRVDSHRSGSHKGETHKVKNSETYFKLISQEGETTQMTQAQTQYKVGEVIDLKDVKTFVQISEGAHREFQAGEQFVYLGNEDFKRGQVVKLHSNDNSDCPFFTIDNGMSTECTYWNQMAKLPNNRAGKAEVTSVATYYSDGVKVSADHVEFDGKKWERTQLEETIKRYTEVLKRPVAEVAAPVAAPKRVRKPVAKK